MAGKNKGTLILDNTVSEKDRNKIGDRILDDMELLKGEVSQRKAIIDKRQDFFEGRHSKYTNVVGLTNKMQEGHILATFNYVWKFSTKLHQALTNIPPKIKIVPQDESDEIETLRAEMVEKMIYKILRDNKFFNVTFKHSGMNQIRDGDFALSHKVIDGYNGKEIVITPITDLTKLNVWWDDASGSSFSAVAFCDMWSLAKVKREFGIDAEPFTSKDLDKNTKRGNHLSDQYGLLASSGDTANNIATGETKLPKAEIIDYWGQEVINGEIKICNLIFVNRELKQFVVTDYKEQTYKIGHSFVNAGRPWSTSFIDGLIDPQVELNDRTSEEGDLIRVGAHAKFLVVNMPDFDPDSITPGSGQVIFIEGEGADFRPLVTNVQPYPTEAYLNRMMEHLFNIGIPKIGLAAGTAPYTGRVAAVQYQPIIDLVVDLRVQWEIVLNDLVRCLQQYLIDYFPETIPFMTEHTDEGDGEPIVREVQFDWENVLPLSKSDRVVDASTLRDRHAISLYTYLEEVGFKDPSAEIKRLKKEVNDPDLVTVMEKFVQWSKGATQAQVLNQQAMAEMQQEQAMELSAQLPTQGGTPESTPPILNSSQNDGRRGVLTGTGSPNGQTASLAGDVAQSSQNINAQSGLS